MDQRFFGCNISLNLVQLNQNIIIGEWDHLLFVNESFSSQLNSEK